MTFLNYEEAQHIFDSADPVAVTIGEIIHSYMLDKFNSSGLSTVIPFDMLYFYHAVCSAVGKVRGKPVHSAMAPHQSILNVPMRKLVKPTSLVELFVTSGLAEAFVQQVQTDSTANGFPFDSSFGFEIARFAFTDERLSYLLSDQVDRKPPRLNDFDSWAESWR